MIRRLVARSLFVLLLILALPVVAFPRSEEPLPVVVHPDTLDFSAEEQALWAAAIEDLRPFWRPICPSPGNAPTEFIGPRSVSRFL